MSGRRSVVRDCPAVRSGAPGGAGSGWERAAADAGIPRFGTAVVRQRVRRLCHRGGTGQSGQPDRAAAHPHRSDQ